MKKWQGLPIGKARIYMKLGPPPYFLPEAIADSAADLARKLGLSGGHVIIQSIAHTKSGKIKNPKYCSVIIDLEEEEEDDYGKEGRPSETKKGRSSDLSLHQKADGGA